ncbi:MAG TPA: hypothetical protein VNL98_00655 [Gemmatimonadales bacterium]|nr:hypothetical protein [Gemmatimonadales bacterium]
MKRALWLTVAILAGAAVPMAAQDRPRLYTGLEMRTLSFDPGLGTASLSQTIIPIGLAVPLGRRLSLDAGVRFATSTREDEAGASTTLSGLTDTQLRGVFQVIPNTLLLTLSANLPTGKTELTDDELLVAGAMADDLIAFPVSSYGTGFSLTSGLAAAVPLGGWALGLAGSYRFSGEFTPVADTSGATYKPGAEMRFRVGLDRLVGQGRLSLGLTYSTFSVDEFAGSEAFRPGKRLVAQASWSFPIGNHGLALYAWNYYRASGQVADALGGAATGRQDIVTLGLSGSIQIGRSVLRPTLEWRQLLEEDAGSMVNAGTLISAGVRLRMQLGNRYALIPSVRYDFGGLDNDAGTRVGFGGLSASVTLRATL